LKKSSTTDCENGVGTMANTSLLTAWDAFSKGRQQAV
jgi:hypothetical protein